MRPIALAILTTLCVSGCDSQHERLLKTMEKYIHTTIRMDWEDGIPLPDLLDAHKMCQQEANLKGCDVVTNDLADIFIALASCKADQRSKLCKAIVHAFNHESVPVQLQESEVLTLPDTPLYWSLPTRTLESQADKFGYRSEVTSWWWQAWRTYILTFITLLVCSISAWKWFGYREKISQQHATILAEQRAEKIKRQHIQKVHKEQAQMENERLEWLAIDEALANEQRIAKENLAQQQAAESATQLAKEKAEVAKLLASAFMPSSSKQRKTHAPTSK